jgi:energy-coupling factor transport system permease protein
MNAIVTSEDVANAMDLRCFGQAKRTWIYPLNYHWGDYALITFSALTLIGSIVAVYVLDLGGFWVPDWFVRFLI